MWKYRSSIQKERRNEEKGGKGGRKERRKVVSKWGMNIREEWEEGRCIIVKQSTQLSPSWAGCKWKEGDSCDEISCIFFESSHWGEFPPLSSFFVSLEGILVRKNSLQWDYIFFPPVRLFFLSHWREFIFFSLKGKKSSH